MTLSTRSTGGEPRRALPMLSVQQVPLFEELQAQLIGVLEVDASTNCLVLRTGDALVDVAWPVGWSVAIRDGEIALVDAGGQTVGSPGDEVFVGGGFVDAGQAGVVSCAGHEHVFQASRLTGP